MGAGSDQTSDRPDSGFDSNKDDSDEALKSAGIDRPLASHIRQASLRAVISEEDQHIQVLISKLYRTAQTKDPQFIARHFFTRMIYPERESATKHFCLNKAGCFFARFQKTQGLLQKNSCQFLAKNSMLWRQLWLSRKKLKNF